MFQWTKKKIIKSVAKELPRRLAIKFGKKDNYSPSEIDWALSALNKADDVSYRNYAYGMLTSHSFFMSFGLSSSFGAQSEFHKEIGNVLFNQECTPDFDSYLEYAAVHASAPKLSPANSSDGINGVDAGSDSSSDIGGL
jgi:hypothetical protein